MSESSSPEAGAGDAGAPASLDDQLVAAFRAHSLETGFFLHAVADRLDMTATDFACLTLLLLEGPCTAGALAERTGLTTGAITGVIDRLAGQGRVRRGVDPADRRKVIVEPVSERARDLAEVIGPMIVDARRLHAQYSPSELRTVLRFVTEARHVLAQHTAALRRGAGPLEEAEGSVTVPRGQLSAATLHVAGLAARLVLRAADIGDALCRVDLGGPAPTVRAWAGHVVVQLRARRRAPVRGEVLVSPDVTWAVDIRGGWSQLEVDLGSARISGIAVRGGARRLDLLLPEPEGPVPIRVMGGASRLTVRRPAGIPVAVRLHGGASEVVVDGRRVQPGFDRMPLRERLTGGPGYELEIRGGASRLFVEPY